MSYQLPNGQNIADIYEPLQPGMPRADNTGFQLFNSNGDLADLSDMFCAISGGGQSTIRTGFQVLRGQQLRDLSDIFAARGTVTIAPSFNNQTYSSSSQGGSGETGQISAGTQFRLDGSGNFLATGNDNYTGGYTFQQGRVWAYGAPAEWLYRLYATSGAPYDTGWVSGAQAAFVEVSASRPASLPGQVEFSRDMVFETRRASGGNIITAKFWIHAGVYSWI